MSNRCEDYPCCGHTDGLGCGWTYTPEARAYDMEHAYCDHEAGFCEAYDTADDDVCYDCGEHEDECCCDDDYDEGGEDRHLDGSYEE